MCPYPQQFQLTAARRRLGFSADKGLRIFKFQLTAARRRLELRDGMYSRMQNFNSQPREGGWNCVMVCTAACRISTHSRAKAAGTA